MLLVQAAAYDQQYGFNTVSFLSANLYGPRDKSYSVGLELRTKAHHDMGPWIMHHVD